MLQQLLYTHQTQIDTVPNSWESSSDGDDVEEHMEIICDNDNDDII